MGLPSQSSQHHNNRPSRNSEEVQDPDYRLDDDEKKLWAAAVAGAGVASPVLLSALTMLQPYKSKITDVAAIDQDWRVALGDAFFDYPQHEREAIIIHECLHATCNHFARARIDGQSDPEISNVAEDLEINQMVASLRRVKLPDGALYPNTPEAPANAGIIDVPAGQLMESYYRMISNGHGDDYKDKMSQQGGVDNQTGESQSGEGSQWDNQQSQGNRRQSNRNDQNQSDNDGQSSDESDNGEQSSNNGGSPGQDDWSSSNRNDGQPNQRMDGDGQSDQQSDDGNGDDGGGNGSHGNPRGGESNQSSDANQRVTGLCGNREIDRIRQEADEAGVRKVRPASKTKATEMMLDETAKRMAMNGVPGISTLDATFLVALNKVIHPPELNWRSLLRTTASDLMSKQAYQKTEYSFKRVNRRGSAFMQDCAFPSMIGYAPIVMMAIDTSGSRVDGEQFAIDMQNASEILKAVGKLSKKSFSAFCVDTDIKKIQPVSRVEDLDFTGGGGTDMSVAFKYVRDLPRKKRPDIFVLSTDGGFDWDKCARVWPDGMKIIILITDSWYMQPGKIPAWVYDEAKVIDCSVKHH